MVAWLIYHRENANYNKRYIEFYKEEGAKLGIDVKLLLVEELKFGVHKNKWFLAYQKEELSKPDFVICRAIYPLLSRQLEMMGIPVFNNSMVSEVCNDKARTYQYLAKTGITMVDTCFYKNEQVKDVLSQMHKPAVIKAVDGHGGNQVFLTSGEDAARAEDQNARTDRLEQGAMSQEQQNIIAGIKSSDVVIQPLTGSRNQDLRVYVIGREIIAAVLRTAREGFKSNFSLGGEVSLYQLSPQEITIVNRIINEFEFGLVGIDFIIGDEDELIFNEIEDVAGSRMLYQCADINIVERYLKYILRQIGTVSQPVIK